MIFLKHEEQGITFDLNEALTFETHQEIEEMISISLDPDIVIETYKKHLQIRGVILLSGKYHRRPLQQHEQSFEQSENKVRYIEKVIDLDENVAQFSHRFPLEITVAKDRVEDLDHVVVTIESFDYDLPSSDTLNVFASLHIYGIRPEPKQETNNDKLDKKKKVEEPNVEALKTQTKSSPQENEKMEKSPSTTDTKEEEKETIITESKDDAETNQANQWRDDIGESLEERQFTLIKNDIEPKEKQSGIAKQAEPVKQPKMMQKSEAVNQIGTTKKGAEDTSEIGEKEHLVESNEKEVETFVAVEGEEMQIALAEAEEEEDSPVKDVTFLTELFDENEEKEVYTQLKIYIAQENDSIESIAKRYGIPVLQLLKDNDLSGHSIEEGQLITIRQESSS